jgi:hypothetical protein
MLKKFFGFSVLISSVFFLGCENKEKADLVKAQTCLDAATSETALTCLDSISGYDTAQANVLKCSIYFYSGGLTTQRLVNAYKQLDTSSTNKEAAFIAALTLTGTSPADGLEKANQANSFCKKSGLSSLIYLGGLSVMGTSLYAVAPGGAFGDLANGVLPSQAEIDAAVDQCLTSCDATTLAGIATTVSTTYCTGSNTTSDVCKKIAESETYGSEQGTALLCIMNGKTFTVGTPSTCT